MATVRDIITTAMRRARIIGLGRAPKAAEADDGLVALQGYYDGLFAHGPFSALADVYTTENYTAKENERIVADGATITIPDTLEEGTRTPKDLSAVIVITDTTQRNYVFSLGRWEACDALTLDSEAPLSKRDKEGLACALAVDLAESYAQAVGPRVMEKASRFNSSLMQWADMSFPKGLTNAWLVRDLNRA
jgi:hypothetical protein